jgi:hypothetical protein
MSMMSSLAVSATEGRSEMKMRLTVMRLAVY